MPYSDRTIQTVFARMEKEQEKKGNNSDNVSSQFSDSVSEPQRPQVSAATSSANTIRQSEEAYKRNI